MKKYVNMLFAMTLVGLMAMNVSCSNEEADNTLPEEKNEIITIYATISEPDAETRLGYDYLEDSGRMRIYWEEGDEFILYQGQNKVGTFVYKRMVEGNIAEFECNNFTGEKNRPIGVAVYYPENTSEGWSSINVDMEGQTQNENDNKDNLSMYNVMIAGSVSVDENNRTTIATFEHITSILRMDITLLNANSDITSTSLTLKTDGRGFQTQQNLATTHLRRDSPQITLGLDIEGDSFIAYIAVIGGGILNNNMSSKVEDFLKFTVETNEGTYSKKVEFLGESQTYTAGKIYSSAVTLEKEWEVGDYWPKEGTPRGIVYSVGENILKIISLEEHSGLAWETTVAYFAGDNNQTASEAMGIALSHGIENYPAFNYCYTLNNTEGWLLPTLIHDYLPEIDPIFSILNESLTAKEEKILDGHYWTSTINTQGFVFTYPPLNILKGTSTSEVHRVRCIKELNKINLSR